MPFRTRSFPVCFAALFWGLQSAVWCSAAEALPASAVTSSAYSRDQYLNEVREKNQTIQSLVSSNTALELSRNEVKAAFSPYVNGQLSWTDNQAEALNPLFQGDRSRIGTLSLGVSKRWVTGTLSSLTYQVQRTLMDYPALSVPIPGFSLSSDPYYVASPILSLTQPLWKDFMAHGTLATLEKVTASSQMAQTLNRFKIQQILFAAEQAYIQLALAREVVAVQQQSLKNYQSILEWTTRRAARNLVDQVDVLQSQAAMAQVELSLASALESQHSAEVEFNTLRGQSSDPEIPALDPFASPGNAEVGRKQDRADLQAALLDLKAREAAVAEVVNTYQPDVSLFGTLSLNGLDTETAPALAESWSVSHPNATVGIKLSANLDLPLIFKTLEGARLAANAGSQDITQKRADLQKDWDKLLRRWQSVQERLLVADRLEKLQKAKADREKERFKLGRTTHFQVLRFEEDFSQAKLQRLNLLAEANLIAAQSKLYNNQE